MKTAKYAHQDAGIPAKAQTSFQEPKVVSAGPRFEEYSASGNQNFMSTNYMPTFFERGRGLTSQQSLKALDRNIRPVPPSDRERQQPRVTH